MLPRTQDLFMMLIICVLVGVHVGARVRRFLWIRIVPRSAKCQCLAQTEIGHIRKTCPFVSVVPFGSGQPLIWLGRRHPELQHNCQGMFLKWYALMGDEMTSNC